MEKKIKIPTNSDKLDITLTITEEMARELKECERMATDKGEDKDCDTCIWNSLGLAEQWMCEQDAVYDAVKDWEVPDE